MIIRLPVESPLSHRVHHRAPSRARWGGHPLGRRGRRGAGRGLGRDRRRPCHGGDAAPAPSQQAVTSTQISEKT